MTLIRTVVVAVAVVVMRIAAVDPCIDETDREIEPEKVRKDEAKDDGAENLAPTVAAVGAEAEIGNKKRDIRTRNRKRKEVA